MDACWQRSLPIGADERIGAFPCAGGAPADVCVGIRIFIEKLNGIVAVVRIRHVKELGLFGEVKPRISVKRVDVRSHNFIGGLGEMRLTGEAVDGNLLLTANLPIAL